LFHFQNLEPERGLVQKNRYILGVDLGGTKILSAVVDYEGTIISQHEEKTPASEGFGPMVQSLFDSMAGALDSAGIPPDSVDAAGVAAAGASDPERGILFTSPNLPGWKDVPLGEMIAERLGKKAFIINDGGAAAIGEYYFGNGRGFRNFIYVTISTGVGGGIIIDGVNYTGTAGVAGEIGHMTIDDDGPLCNCGNRGCWEMFASGTALAREARKRILEGMASSILRHSGNDVGRVSARSVVAAAREGDALALELIGWSAHYLGVGFANLINIFNPELIITGGGLSNAGDILLQPAYEIAGRRAFKRAFSTVSFRRAGLGKNSGVVGAAAFAREQLKKKM
jgi:glucokinase